MMHRTIHLPHQKLGLIVKCHGVALPNNDGIKPYLWMVVSHNYGVSAKRSASSMFIDFPSLEPVVP